MAEEEYGVNEMGSQEKGNPKSREECTKRQKNKKKNHSRESLTAEEEKEVHGDDPLEEGSLQSGDTGPESGRRKRKKKILKEIAVGEEGTEKPNVKRAKKLKNKNKNRLLEEKAKVDKDNEEIHGKGSPEELNPWSEGGAKEEWEKQLLKESANDKDEQLVNGVSTLEMGSPEYNNKWENRLGKKKKEWLLKEAAKADKRGVCYLSRIPPRMDHVKLRQILSQYGEIQRIYLASEGFATAVNSKRARGFQEQRFSEGWVEFTNKSVAKRVANVLNGEQIGGRKRSQFYYDLWNIKYLSKFNWDDLTEEIAYKTAIREQKLALEISAAKREKDFYLSKVDQHRALSSIEERMKKKQNVQQESGAQHSVSQQAPKVIRQFTQTKPVVNKTEQSKPKLSKDILAGVFGGS